ncbi:MAG TPA: EAL domain-containing protein [Candidatus Competibacteraceae bacterium]|nr:EAL domain-containing protein [Candidatus Competibacteraceae bacterium]
MEPKPALPHTLINKLQRINDLAEKLVYIKWSQEFFVLLLRAAQDILTLTRPLPEHHRITTLAERLEQQVSACLEKSELPRGTERERLMAVLDALCRAIPASSARSSESGTHRPIETITTPLFLHNRESEQVLPSTGRLASTLPILWLVAPELVHDLGRKLEQRGGFQIQFFMNLSEVHALLEQPEKPVALIIDLDYAADQQATFHEITELQPLLAADTPLFFLADRGDITARIEAAKVGGAGYFIKPVDIPMLLEALDGHVLKPLNQRILIVDDQLPAAREIARWLESHGMVTQVLAQPLQILPALRHFQPNLLILNLDLKDLDGVNLAQAIQQHELFRELPLVLLSAQLETAQRLSDKGLSGEVLLGKPPKPELLSAAVAKRLQQGRGLYYKFSQLSHRDTVSGLYNRPYFLAYLERALVATHANAQSAAIMLITLDNLRTLESHDVAAADEVVEQAAKRLQTTLGAGALTARFSDAVFTVLLGFTGQEALPVTAQVVQTALETKPYRLSDGDFELRTSIGISIASPTLREAALLIQQADLACGMAREGKDTRIHVHHGHSVEQDMTSPQQRRLLDEIRESVQQQRMNLLFQPIVSLRGDTTERYEVLLRMRNHAGWEILPETLFSLVKRHRIGMVLDRWVIAHSIRVLRQRRKRGQSVVLFINISPTILQDEEFVPWLQGGLHKTGVPGASLVFEMTETTAELYKPVLQPFLLQIKGLGCGVSLDHFSGHAHSQALAQSLQAEYIKLDARFTDDLLNNKARQEELSQLVHTLGTWGMTTIVTGIEDARTLPALWASGINYVQGFFLQRPHTEMSYDFDQTVL